MELMDGEIRAALKALAKSVSELAEEVCSQDPSANQNYQHHITDRMSALIDVLGD